MCLYVSILSLNWEYSFIYPTLGHAQMRNDVLAVIVSCVIVSLDRLVEASGRFPAVPLFLSCSTAFEIYIFLIAPALDAQHAFFHHFFYINCSASCLGASVKRITSRDQLKTSSESVLTDRSHHG